MQWNMVGMASWQTWRTDIKGDVEAGGGRNGQMGFLSTSEKADRFPWSNAMLQQKLDCVPFSGGEEVIKACARFICSFI